MSLEGDEALEHVAIAPSTLSVSMAAAELQVSLLEDDVFSDGDIGSADAAEAGGGNAILLHCSVDVGDAAFWSLLESSLFFGTSSENREKKRK